jgi:hypothetical protein
MRRLPETSHRWMHNNIIVQCVQTHSPPLSNFVTRHEFTGGHNFFYFFDLILVAISFKMSTGISFPGGKAAGA